MNAFRNIILGLILVAATGSALFAQNNPGNPCGGKAMKSATATNDQNGRVFEVNDPMNRNYVTFKSTAPLEDIVGTSNQVTGQLVFDPANPNEGGRGKLGVPVNSLRTGIPLRDEHLAGADWLNAANNPDITFNIAEVKDVKQVKVTPDAQTYDVVAIGDFSLNGVTKRISVPARITYLKESEMTKQKAPGDLLAARSTFEVALADYGITGPKGMNLIGSKVGDKAEVELSLVASSNNTSVAEKTQSGGQTMNAGNPCGGKM